MFVDEAEVHLRAGRGGDGCVGFRREKFMPKGGPDGGDGGRGGDVVLIGDENTSDLSQFQYTPNQHAKNGEPGQGRDRYGHAGADLQLRLPLGTVVVDPETDRMVIELTESGQRVVLLHGGKGGLGNLHFKSSTNRTPRQATAGEPGEEGSFRLVLKTIADVGLVGFPNAGKSTLTNRFTRAHPKMAAYPFTTLHVHVGIIEYPETYDRIRLADIPGLIEGSSENKGLGHEFLRHIERCRLLLIMLDMAGTDGRDPLKDYQHLLDELGSHDATLLEKPSLVAANKMDMPEAAKNLQRFRRKFKKVPVLGISCLTGDGLEELKTELRERVRKP
ncbi:MAG: GTPase ObgE [Opitutales bacterium]|jgi:GTP-binding protein